MTSNSGISPPDNVDEFEQETAGMASYLRRPDVDPDTEERQRKTYLYHGTST